MVVPGISPQFSPSRYSNLKVVLDNFVLDARGRLRVQEFPSNSSRLINTCNGFVYYGEQHNQLPFQMNNKTLIELHRGPAYIPNV